MRVTTFKFPGYCLMCYVFIIWISLLALIRVQQNLIEQRAIFSSLFPSLRKYGLKEIFSGGSCATCTKIYSFVDIHDQQDFNKVFYAENYCIQNNNYILTVDNESKFKDFHCINFTCNLFDPVKRGGDSNMIFEVSQEDRSMYYGRISFLTNTFTRSQHPDHWITPLIWKYVIFANRQDYEGFPEPRYVSLAYQLSDHPTGILFDAWSVFLRAYDLFPGAHVLFYKDMHELDRFCFKKVFFSSGGVYNGGNPTFVTEFRNRLLQHFNLPSILNNVTKIKNAVFLLRNEGNGLRRVLNYDELVGFIEKKYKINISVRYINSLTPSFEQAKIFNSADLIISSHSSQLFNMMFSRFNTTVLELIPRFYSGAFIYRAPIFGIRYKICEGGNPDWNSCGDIYVAAEAKMKTGVLCDFFFPLSILEECLSSLL